VLGSHSNLRETIFHSAKTHSTVEEIYRLFSRSVSDEPFETLVSCYTSVSSCMIKTVFALPLTGESNSTFRAARRRDTASLFITSTTCL
jgi:hypothetical protein